MAEIAVVIPVYNGEKYIKQLTDCLKKQTFSSFVAIFVDDCSTDHTADTLKNALCSAPFDYRIVSTGVNSGAGIARNIGMRFVDTQYFCFIDADDYISENYFEELYNTACITKAEIVFSRYVRCWDDKKELDTGNLDRISQHINDPRYITACGDFGPCAKLMATSLWDEKICGFPGRIRGEDGASIPVLYARTSSFAVCENAVYYYYQTPGSRSRSVGSHYKDPLMAWTILSQRISDQEILEYKYTMAVGYAVIRNAIRYGVSRKEILEYCSALKEKYPHCLKNRFFRSNTRWQKKVFVTSSYYGLSFLLKLMVKAVG